MKFIAKSVALLLIVFLAGCELEPQVQIAANPVGARIIVPESGHIYNYTAENEDDEVLFILSPADYGFPAKFTYYIEMDHRGGDFKKARILAYGGSDSIRIDVSDVNGKIKKLKYKEGEVAKLDLRVISNVSDIYEDVASDIIEINYKVY